MLDCMPGPVTKEGNVKSAAQESRMQTTKPTLPLPLIIQIRFFSILHLFIFVYCYKYHTNIMVEKVEPEKNPCHSANSTNTGLHFYQCFSSNQQLLHCLFTINNLLHIFPPGDMPIDNNTTTC